MVIAEEKIIERRIRERMPLKTNLIIKSYTNDQEISNATIVNISVGGMHFFIPVDYPKLQLHEICTFIFDLPQLGKSCVLGEIHYCLGLKDPQQQNALHYRAKFINLSMQTWHHIKNFCRTETETSSEPSRQYLPEAQRSSPKLTPMNETLTTKTLALINAEVRLENGSILQGKVKDIDFEGIKLQLSEPISVDMNLNVNVTFAELPFTARGVCDWCDQIGPEMNSYIANISFSQIEQEQFEHLKSLMMKLAAYMADWILKSHDNLANH